MISSAHTLVSAIKPASNPAQEWRLSARGGECNLSAPVRSALAFGWIGANAAQVNAWPAEKPGDFDSPSVFPEGFTCFAPSQPGATLPTDASIAHVPQEQEKRVRLAGLWPASDIGYWGSTREGRPKPSPLEIEHCRQLEGEVEPGASPEKSLAYAIVEIFGSESRSADVAMAHAFVNGHSALVMSLLGKGVPLTLEHLRLGLKVSTLRRGL